MGRRLDLGLGVGSFVRRRSALLARRGAALLAGLVGMGLMTAAAISGLARLMGPIPALALAGAAFLLAAIGLWARSPARPPQPLPAKSASDEPVSEGEAAFAVGFALGRLLLRKLAG